MLKAHSIVVLLTAASLSAAANGAVSQFTTVSGGMTILTDPDRNIVTDLDGFYGEEGRQLRVGNVSCTLAAAGGSLDSGFYDSNTGELDFTIAWNYSFNLTDASNGSVVDTISSQMLFREFGTVGGGPDPTGIMTGEEVGAARGGWRWWFAEWIAGTKIKPKKAAQATHIFEPGQLTGLEYAGSNLADPFEMTITVDAGLGGGVVAGTAVGTIAFYTVPTPGACTLAGAAGLCLLRRRR